MQQKIGTLRLALTFAGCFLGAGYVSGQELWQYFGAFGARGLWGLALAVVLLGGTGVLLLRLSARTGIETMDALIVRADIPWLRTAVGVLTAALLFGVVCIMAAGIGALGDIGCYSLDMVLNAIGYPKPLTVTGYTSNFLGTNPLYNNPADAARFDVDDFAAAFVRLEGDIILDFRIAWAMHVDTPGDTIIMGTKGALRIPSTECWNGTVGGEMTLYTDVAGAQVETKTA